jgi:hypothetical protein
LLQLAQLLFLLFALAGAEAAIQTKAVRCLIKITMLLRLAPHIRLLSEVVAIPRLAALTAAIVIL